MLIVDRFEDDTAIVEQADGSFIEVPRKLIRGDASEGDVLIADGDCYIVDIAQTQLRASRMRHKLDRLFQHSSNSQNQ